MPLLNRPTVHIHRPGTAQIVEILMDPKAAAKGEMVRELEPDAKPRAQPPVRRSTPRYGCEPNHGGLAFYLICFCGCVAYSATPMQTCPQCHRAL